MKDLMVCLVLQREHEQLYSRIHHTNAKRKDMGCSRRTCEVCPKTKWLVCGVAGIQEYIFTAS